MSDENPTETEPTETAADDELRAAVTAAQLSVCTQLVPEALELRLAAAAALPRESWRRNAGHDDSKVLKLEAPYRRVNRSANDAAPKRAARKAPARSSGSRRRRQTTTPKRK